VREREGTLKTLPMKKLALAVLLISTPVLAQERNCAPAGQGVIYSSAICDVARDPNLEVQTQLELGIEGTSAKPGTEDYNRAWSANH
jgi:hypothetical protein